MVPSESKFSEPGIEPGSLHWCQGSRIWSKTRFVKRCLTILHDFLYKKYYLMGNVFST